MSKLQLTEKFKARKAEEKVENGLQIFNFESDTIRTVLIEDEIWFVGKDVCEAFGDTNYRRSLAKIDDDEKGVSHIATPGGLQQMTSVNESGLYSLLFAMQPQKTNTGLNASKEVQERMDKLKRFKRWVTHEVLPSIRKTGSYSIQKSLPKTYAEALRELADTVEENETLKLQNTQQAQIIEEMEPKASYYDNILQSKDAVPITFIAKDYGMTATAMNKLLHDLNVQYKMSDVWLLYKEYSSYGYTKSKTHKLENGRSVMHTNWTQKGRLFIYDLLKREGILPEMER